MPGELERLVHAVRLLRRTDKCVSAVDVHDATLALCRAVALRDSFSTLRDVLSDVPLAVMCLPKPDDASLVDVITGLHTVRQVFQAQVGVPYCPHACTCTLCALTYCCAWLYSCLFPTSPFSDRGSQRRD